MSIKKALLEDEDIIVTNYGRVLTKKESTKTLIKENNNLSEELASRCKQYKEFEKTSFKRVDELNEEITDLKEENKSLEFKKENPEEDTLFNHVIAGFLTILFTIIISKYSSTVITSDKVSVKLALVAVNISGAFVVSFVIIGMSYLVTKGIKLLKKK